jgi:hypothetical protein
LIVEPADKDSESGGGRVINTIGASVRQTHVARAY